MKCWLLFVCFVAINHIFESLLFQHVFWISRGTFTFLRNFKEHCIFPIKVVVKITFTYFWGFNCYVGYFFWVCMQFELYMNERKNVNIKLKFYWIIHNIGKGYSTCKIQTTNSFLHRGFHLCSWLWWKLKHISQDNEN